MKDIFTVANKVGFLTDSGKFSPEYPDARKYTTLSGATKAAIKHNGILVWKNYGFDGQESFVVLDE